MSLRKNVASQVLTFALVNATTGAALTGATVTTKVALDGTQSAGAGTVTELGTGQYKYVPTQGETDGASVGFCFTATNAVPVNLHCFTTSQDPAIAQTGDSYARLGAPAGASVSADVAAVKAETAAIKAKTDNLPAAPASTTNITMASGIAVSSIGANVITATSIAANAITSAKIATDAIGAAQLAADAVAEIVDANWDEVASGHLTAGTTGLALVTAESVSAQIGAPVGVNISADIAAIKAETAATAIRGAVGLASANLDTQLAAIDDLLDTEVAAIYNRIGAPAGASIAADIAGITVTVDAADIRAAIGMASANLDTQLTAIDDLVDTEVAAIKAKTDLIPAAPAATGDIPSAATIASQVRTELTTELGRIDVATSTRLATAGYTAPLDAAGVRTAVGLATANLDTQLTAIDDLVDTEVAAIKTKTDYLPSATAGAAGGLFIAGANAATTVNITGDITGNLSGSVGTVAANGITATSIATDAINAAAVKADAVTKIQTGLATPTNITTAAGIALSAGERTTLANAILDVADGATTNYTLRQALEVMLAVLAGKLSGAATATITIRDINDTQDVLVVTTDASGNRTAATITP